LSDTTAVSFDICAYKSPHAYVYKLLKLKNKQTEFFTDLFWTNCEFGLLSIFILSALKCHFDFIFQLCQGSSITW